MCRVGGNENNSKLFILKVDLVFANKLVTKAGDYLQKCCFKGLCMVFWQPTVKT